MNRFLPLPLLLRASLLGLALLVASGCTSLQTVPLSDLTSAVHVGDTVVCTMRLGRPLTFKVTAVAPDFIVGESRRVYLSDVSQLEIQHFSAGKSVLLVAGVATGGAAAAVAVNPWLILRVAGTGGIPF